MGKIHSKRDANAVHIDTPAEINALTEKGTPVSADLVIIEDSADSNNKKKIQIGNIPVTGTDPNAIHDNTPAEISAVTEKASPVSADLVLIEDSEASNAKKKVQLGNIPVSGTDTNAIHKSTASEITAIAEKTSLVANDEFLMEDSADSNNKKSIKASNLDLSVMDNTTSAFITADTNAIHKNAASEITAIAEKTSLVANDEFLMEDSADSNNKKSIKASNLDLSVMKNTTSAFIATTGVTYEALNGNSDVGTGADQVAAGNHSHTAGDVGAVASSGGTFTGNVAISHGDADPCLSLTQSKAATVYLVDGVGSASHARMRIDCTSGSDHHSYFHFYIQGSERGKIVAERGDSFNFTNSIANQSLKILDAGGMTYDGATFTVNGSLVKTAADVGIANTKLLAVDQADAADNDFAKFTATGIEGRSYTETKTDLSLNNVENTAISTWTGSANITTLGTVVTGTWNADVLGAAYIPPVNYVNNLIVQLDADTDHDINFYRQNTNHPAIVQVRDSSYNTRYVSWSSEMTKQIDATWASGDDAGGLDDNDALGANQTLFAFLLTKSGDSVDFGFTDDSTGVSLLTDAAVVSAGYNEISVTPIFCFVTDASSNLIAFHSRETSGGDLETRYNIASGQTSDNPGTNATTITVPAPAGCLAYVTYILYLDAGAGGNVCALLTETTEPDTAPSTTVFTCSAYHADGAAVAWNGYIKLDASRQIRSRLSGSAAGIGFRFGTLGYKTVRRV